MSEITVTYHNEIKTFLKPISYYEASLAFNVTHAMAAKSAETILPLYEMINENQNVEFIDITQVTGYKIYQAGLKYLFLVAVKEIFPDSEVKFLHSVPKGILSEVMLNRNLTTEDISKIKGMMAKIVTNKELFVPYHLKPKDAYKYLKDKNVQEKADMIQYFSKDLVTMYRLKNHFNYFYTIMPHDTSSINRFELINIGKNRVVLVCPSLNLNGKLPEYVHYENIIENFLDTQTWLKKLNCQYLSNINSLVSNFEIQNFIAINEMKFHEDILKCSEEIIKQKDIRFVLIAGPSSSGKTTAMKRLSTCFECQGYKTLQLSTDDFFVNRLDTPKDENGQYNFESLEAIDLAFFKQTLTSLLNGLEVQLPEYDFKEGKRLLKSEYTKLEENSLIIIEGLHCLNDDLLPFIDNRYKYKIYLSPFMPLNIDRHNYVSTVDLRLIRRITRDRRYRGRSVEETIIDWDSVRNGEEKYIFPYVAQANKIINTALAYELGVLKVYAYPLLYSVPLQSSCYSEAQRLINSLEAFLTINSELVPKDSILREFIG